MLKAEIKKEEDGLNPITPNYNENKFKKVAPSKSRY